MPSPEEISVALPKGELRKDFVKGELRAAPGYVIVEPTAPTTQVGDIILPLEAQPEVFEGRVMHHNPSLKPTKQHETTEYQPGEFVIWGMYAGRDYRWNKTDYKILHETEIIAYVEEPKK